MAHEASEKVLAEHIEHAASDTERSSQEGEEDAIILSPEEQKSLIWRIDRRLVSMAGLMYCISLMDRTNLGSAVIAGYVVPLRIMITVTQKLTL
jgi:hypothetical protein